MFIPEGLSACSPADNSGHGSSAESTENPDGPDLPDNPNPDPIPDPATRKTLVVYYSFTNNVHAIVSDLCTQIDVVRVEPAEKGFDYAADNYAIGSALIQAIRNAPGNASPYPAIDPVTVEFDAYDTILVAAPLQTFLFNHGAEMAGKRIGLIVSSASSGISGVESDARRLIPDGNFLTPSLWIRSSQTADCHSMIAQWLDDLRYAE